MARFYCCSVEGCDVAFWTSAMTFSPGVCPVHDALLIRGPESRPPVSTEGSPMTLLQIILIAFVLLATGWGFALLVGVSWVVNRFTRRK